MMTKNIKRCCVADLVERPCEKPWNCEAPAAGIQAIRNLVKKGLIVDSGKRHDGCIAWRLSERGRLRCVN